MSDIKKMIANWQAKAATVESEEEAKALFEEIQPHSAELTDLFFGEHTNVS